MRVARDGAIPPMLADLHDRWDTPFKSILLIGVPPLLLAPFEIDLVSLSILVALALLLRVIVSALALWNLPNRYPDRYAAASLTLSRRTVRLVAVGSTLSTVVLMLALAGQRPRLLGGFLGWLVLGFVVYKLRSLQLARRNRDLGNAMRELHENE